MPGVDDDQIRIVVDDLLHHPEQVSAVDPGDPGVDDFDWRIGQNRPQSDLDPTREGAHRKEALPKNRGPAKHEDTLETGAFFDRKLLWSGIELVSSRKPATELGDVRFVRLDTVLG